MTPDIKKWKRIHRERLELSLYQYSLGTVTAGTVLEELRMMRFIEMLEVHKRIKDRKAIAKARKPWCEVCGRWGPVHVHHIRSKGAGGDDVPENLISLCPRCHDLVHRGRIPKGWLYDARRS